MNAKNHLNFSGGPGALLQHALRQRTGPAGKVQMIFAFMAQCSRQVEV